MEKYTTQLLVSVFVLIVSGGSAAAERSSVPAAGTAEEVPDTTMKLQGGAQGTLFESLEIEGEDRIRIEFERPELILNLDSESAGGLEWQSIQDVLDHPGVSLVTPLLNQTAGLRRQCFARPWLNQFSAKGVARFCPRVEGVEKWRLMVADSKGITVAAFEGEGKPPKEIVWDGRSLEGKPVPPGLTYSYVLEAFDRAGNKKNFLGDAFELPAYRVDTPDGRLMLFSGVEVSSPQNPVDGKAATPPVLLDAANYINMESDLNVPVRIEVTARSFEEADHMAGDVVSMLKPYLLGNVKRIQPVAKVQTDAPESGTVVVLLPRS